MFGTAGVSHEWDTLSFALSTIPAILTFLFIAAANWEQLRRRPSPKRLTNYARVRGTNRNSLPALNVNEVKRAA
jgi:hypothetical protein